MTEHNFKWALECSEEYAELISKTGAQRECWELHNAIQFALKLAHAVQSGEVSEGMYDVGDKVCMRYADTGRLTDAEDVFKAMTQKLMEEISDE